HSVLAIWFRGAYNSTTRTYTNIPWGLRLLRRNRGANYDRGGGMTYKQRITTCVFTMAAGAALTAPAWAQQRKIRSVPFYRVKPDRVGDFQGAIKEYNSVLLKGGSDRYYTVWQSLTGSLH